MSEGTVICHIQIKVIPVLYAVLRLCQKGVLWVWWEDGGQAFGFSLLFFAAGFGAASVAAFVLACGVIRCGIFLFGAAFGFGFGSFA